MEGSLTFYLNDEKHPLKAGELMIINSNEVHSIDSPEENHTAVLQIPLKQFEDYFTAHRFVRFAGSVPEMDATLWRLVREMYKLYGKRGVGYEFKIRSFYYDVLYFLVNHYRLDEAGEQEVRHSRRLDALARITSYMREHYQEELKLTEVANMFGYSDAYLSRMFQKYANVNFKTYLQDIRMPYAYFYAGIPETIQHSAKRTWTRKIKNKNAKTGGSETPVFFLNSYKCLYKTKN